MVDAELGQPPTGLRRLALGDVVDDGKQQKTAEEADRRAEDLHVANRAVGPAMAKIEMVAPVFSRQFHLPADLVDVEGIDLVDPFFAEVLATPAVKNGRRRVGVDDLHAFGIDQEHDRVIVLEEAAIALLALAQLFVRPPVFDPQPLLFQRPQHRRPQAREMILEDVIPSSGLHAGNRRRLVEGTGHENEGDVGTAGQGQIQSGEAVEARQVIVAKNHLGCEIRQRRQIVLAGLHPPEAGVGQNLAHLVAVEFGVGGGILHQQYP